MTKQSITENPNRIGRFTSSNIWRLMSDGKAKAKGSLGKPALTYIKEVSWERKLGRSLQVEKTSNAMKWGLFLESRVHDLLPLGYETISNVTTPHPTLGEYWSGSQDSINRSESVMADIKCYEPKAFCEYVDNLTQAQKTGNFSILEKENAKEWWQLISNACIWDMKFIEAVVYMPYLSEISEIRTMAENYDGDDQYKYRFIAECPVCELPYLPDNGEYKNLNVFRFEVSQDDKDRLTERVQEAVKLLNQ